jgi:anti-sigma factor RsiW
MTACPEYEPLLIERAAGDLSPADAARLEAHLTGPGGCAACQAEGAAFAEALDLTRLPPPTEAERRALANLADPLERQARAAARRRAWPARAVAVTAVAAAAVAFLVAPAFSRRGPHLDGMVALAPVEAPWEAPDPDALLEEAGVALPDAARGVDEADTILEAAAGWTDLAGDSL